ncbi:hypothetical protein VNO78_19287 [Psophocarpus tetragonolobus]|uniref:Gnk2-homologous domain-containing protein n=1 Tax=Psophocarpus tetragonolobus TaxID=3891 RepID=A0AAN9S7F7_PSOTE
MQQMLIKETLPGFSMRNSDNATDVDQFNQVLRNLLDSLISQASSGDSQRKFAAANVTGPGFQTIYGLVQCTPDLSGQECNACLVEAITGIPRCCDSKKGGRILNPSCNFRYEIYRFYDPTNIAIPLAPAPAAPPKVSVLPPSSTDTLPTEGKSNTSIIAIAIVVPIAFVILVILIWIYLIMRRSRKHIEVEAKNDNEIRSEETLQLDFFTVMAATNNFSDSNKLGQGGFGPVYKTWQNWREGTTSNIVDPTITDGSRNEIVRCVHIALLCVQESVVDRPTMASVVLMLNSYSVTLPLPSQPAFSIDRRSLSVIQSEEYDRQAGTSDESNIQSIKASENEASITEPFPR